MLSGTSGPCPVSLACVVACLQTWGGVGPSTFLLGVSSLVVTTSSLVVSIDDHSLSMHAFFASYICTSTARASVLLIICVERLDEHRKARSAYVVTARQRPQVN